MLVVALFIIFEKWKQPKHPLIDEWTNVEYANNENLFGHKKTIKNTDTCYHRNEP